MTSLGEALPLEMVRVLREVMPSYLAIGPSGGLALALMCDALADAAQSIADQDIGAMMTALESLRGFHT